MLAMLKKLKRVFGLEAAKPPAPPEPTSYEIGLSGPPEKTLQYFLSNEVQRGARDALKQGRPENFAALLTGLKPVVSVRFPISGTTIFHTRPQIIYDALGDLDGAYIKQSLAKATPDDRQQILDETLAYASQHYSKDRAKVYALLMAGANPDFNDGLALRGKQRPDTGCENAA